ncbi:amino acid ABC transporter permease [Janibacter sp. YB324]|uniref:amino acid ABC transporter permease n=1 Tax=Janibacter sp. YB324 TaxID=2761047 RepID=UPI001623810D|nr:amino acid ABC transporter permease [Janibacter sp. YB324]QNF93047.1 amino acid ABC transporter permease [Janibacter sp. YB324]
MSELFQQFDVWGAFCLTIKLAVFSLAGALVLGTIIAIMRVSPVAVFRFAGSAYVNIVRNTPLTLILTFTIMVMLYDLGINLADENSPTSITDNGVRWAIVGLAVYHAAFVCEAIRSGINTVPPGQAEAARSIGLGFTQNLRHVVLPQAIRGAIAPLASVTIALIKNTTVAAAIGVAETAALMSEAIELRADLNYVTFALVAGFFLLLTLPIGIGLTSLSRRMAVKR